MTRRTKSLTSGLVLGALAALALLLFFASDTRRGLAAPGVPYVQSVITATGPYTAYLPLLAHWYDPDRVSPFGVRMGHIDDAHGLQAMEDAGTGWVITDLAWSTIEPVQDDFQWEGFDARVQNAQAAGLDVFVMFTSNPSWAAELRGGPVDDIQDLVDVSWRMAERYDCDGIDDAPGSPCVHYWSFYGEPDNGDLVWAQRGWGYWGDNGAGFAQMLSHISPAIHAANSRAQVLIGGIAYDWFVEDGGPFRRAFLGDTLSALNTYPGGAKRYIDAVAFHYYPISEARWPSIRSKALEIRGIMTQHGVGDLPLVCPEAAYWSSPAFGSSETRQAQRLVQMHVRSLSVGMRPLTWYKIYDSPPPADPTRVYPDQTSGLLRADGSVKPAYTAYGVLARELAYCYYRRALLGPAVEGYVFEVGPAREMTVLWATGTAKTVSFPCLCVRRVALLGTETNVTDGGAGDADGMVNGQVLLRVEQDSPIYVEPCH